MKFVFKKNLVCLKNIREIREIRVQKNLVCLKNIRLIREIRVQKNLVCLRIIRLIREIRVQKNIRVKIRVKDPCEDSRERFVVHTVTCLRWFGGPTPHQQSI